MILFVHFYHLFYSFSEKRRVVKGSLTTKDRLLADKARTKRSCYKNNKIVSFLLRTLSPDFLNEQVQHGNKYLFILILNLFKEVFKFDKWSNKLSQRTGGKKSW